MYNINRRKFLGLFGCSCCSLILPSCTTVPITDRKQLSLIPEAKINQQAAAAYEKFKIKAKLIKKGSQLKEVVNIGKRIETAVSSFFSKFTMPEILAKQDLFVMLLITSMTLGFMFFAKKLGRIYGSIGLILYACYMYFIFI